jgi:dCTP deaminase
MILSAQSIIRRQGLSVFNGEYMIRPFYETKQLFDGMSYGLSSAGYDFRLSLNGVKGTVNDEFILKPKENILASLMEYINVPDDILITFENKSSLIRRLITVHNTVFEPNWQGYATVEISNLSNEPFILKHGMPIGQGLFHRLDEPTVNPYNGKYQNQPNIPVKFKLEV